MDLSRVKGLGQAKISALQAAGINNAEDLASIDLRRGHQVEGVSQDAMKTYKQRARKLLQAEGIHVEKAPYRREKRPSAKGKAKAPSQGPSSDEKKVGLLRRFLGRQ